MVYLGGYILKHILGVMKSWCWVEVPQNLRQSPDMTIDWDVHVMHQRNQTHLGKELNKRLRFRSDPVVDCMFLYCFCTKFGNKYV